MAKRTYAHEAPEPLEGNVMAAVVIITVGWFVLFLVQLPLYGWLDDHDRLWWLWTCLTGSGLGLACVWDLRRRERAAARTRTRAETPPGETV